MLNEESLNSMKDKSSTYWNSYYKKDIAPSNPSSYSELVKKELKEGDRILDVGCGNGRDSVYFSKNNIDVIAIDRCPNAISYCNKYFSKTSIHFFHGVLGEIEEIAEHQFDAIYSRFVIHAMPEKDEISLISESYKILKENGRFFIECRSINDPLFKKGDKVSQTERISGHYRRFIVMDQLIKNLKTEGFKISSQTELDGVAICGDDNPVVIRITAYK